MAQSPTPADPDVHFATVVQRHIADRGAGGILGHLRSSALVLGCTQLPEIAKLFSLRSKTLLFETI